MLSAIPGSAGLTRGLTIEEEFYESLRASFTAQLLDEGIPPHLIAKYMRNRHLDTFEVRSFVYKY